MIIPAIIPSTLNDLRDQLELLSFADTIQIDLVDGNFVSNISWPYELGSDISEAADMLAGRQFEVDLMVREPLVAANQWLSIGASSIVFHLESFDDPEDILNLKNDFDFSLGVAVNNDTELEKLFSLVDNIDFVQLMGIAEIGSQGQPFDSRVIQHIVTLRSLYPDLVISIDGGVNEETITALKEAGANRFVVGSTILNAEDPQKKYEELLKISE